MMSSEQTNRFAVEIPSYLMRKFNKKSIVIENDTLINDLKDASDRYLEDIANLLPEIRNKLAISSR